MCVCVCLCVCVFVGWLVGLCVVFVCLFVFCCFWQCISACVYGQTLDELQAPERENSAGAKSLWTWLFYLPHVPVYMWSPAAKEKRSSNATNS